MFKLRREVIVQYKNFHNMTEGWPSYYNKSSKGNVVAVHEIIAKAMKCHEKGDLEEAEQKYKEAINNKIYDKRGFANLAALLRKKGNSEEAAYVANEGLRLTDPNSPILLNTLANTLRDLRRYEEAINMYRRAIECNPEYYDPRISLVVTLSEAGYKRLSDLTLKAHIRHYGLKDQGIINQIILREVEKASLNNEIINPGLKDFLKKLDNDPRYLNKLPQHWFSLANICLGNRKIEEAIDYYKNGISQIQENYKKETDAVKEKLDLLYTVSSWNFGCQLLRYGQFEMGWKLYEHGLRTPCEGKQRWQRSLYKPFSTGKVTMWKGESLNKKRILLKLIKSY